MSDQIECDCCVVGGGPAGLMAGLLFARAGVQTVVLEKHADFLRDFRGDTIHPSTLEVLNELGLLEEFLRRPHQKVEKAVARFGSDAVEVADFGLIDATCKFVAMAPQWDFLNLIAEAGQSIPTFSLHMRTPARDLLVAGDRVIGVQADGPDGPVTINAKLTIGADGRSSTIRERAGLRVAKTGVPIDVLWFRIPKSDASVGELQGYFGAGNVVVLIDRGDYYQCAYVIPKGGADEIRARGIAALRSDFVSTVPALSEGIATLKSFDDVKLLSVAVDRLEHWSKPGLLMIGDSAHAMSPLGGVGINLAIQDAVAAANLLSEGLANGTLGDSDLDSVRKRREFPVRAVQFAQTQAQNRIITPLLAEKNKMPRPPLAMRIISHSRLLKRMTARLIGLGVRPEHVHSPERYRPKITPSA